VALKKAAFAISGPFSTSLSSPKQSMTRRLQFTHSILDATFYAKGRNQYPSFLLILKEVYES